jgi:hypothetical protein
VEVVLEDWDVVVVGRVVVEAVVFDSGCASWGVVVTDTSLGSAEAGVSD